jgi:hypothetical protein
MNAIEKLTTRKSVVKTDRAFRASNPVLIPIENQSLELDIVSGMNTKVERKIGREGKRETAHHKDKRTKHSPIARAIAHALRC